VGPEHAFKVSKDSSRTGQTKPARQLSGRPLVQAKLSVGPAGDRYELEADRVAAAVVRALQQPRDQVGPFDVPPHGTPIQRMTDRIARSAPRHLAASGDAGGERLVTRIQRNALAPVIGSSGGEIDAATDDAIRRSAGRGRPLDDDVRGRMEQSFGANFSDVRVHADRTADLINRRIQAAAFTTGSDIYFSAGRYNPSSRGGQELLAHELTHVVQQGAGSVRRRPVLQRYSLPSGKKPDDPRNEERLSADQRMHRKSAHYLFVDPALVPPANATLANVGGGAGSFVELCLLNEFQGKLQRVVPIVRQRQTQLLRSQSPRKPFLEQAGPTYQSPADCHVAAQTVMGSDDSAIGAFNTEQPRMAMPGQASQNFAPADEGGIHVANRAKHAFFARAMPAFADLLRNHSLATLPQYKKVVAAIDAVDPATVQFGMGNEWAAIYRDVILKEKAIAKMFAATFKVNEFAEPAVGRAFTNVNDESQKLAKEQAGDDVWNFHWAGIVLVSGREYASLENLSTENINELNTNWYFQIYGESSQSFHAESLGDPHATAGAITLGVDTTSQAAHPARNLKPTVNQQMVLHWLADPSHDNATLDQLDTCPVKFGTAREALHAICDKLFGYSKEDVNTTSDFAAIQRDIRQAIIDRGIPTTPPVARGAPTLGALRAPVGVGVGDVK
jgi:hypothetical protein